MHIRSLDDDRLVLVFSDEEHKVLDREARMRKLDKGKISIDILEQLQRPSNPRLVAMLIALAYGAALEA